MVVPLAEADSRTYDEYLSELASGHLSWTPVHESDDFWRENASKLNEKDYEQLKSVSCRILIHDWALNQHLQDPHPPIEY